GIRELGRTQIRPLGIEADRAGKPVDPNHPFYALLLKLGLGRTRWLGGEESEDRKPEKRKAPDRRSPAFFCLRKWRTGTAASPFRFPVRGSASRRCCRWEHPSRRSASFRAS